MSSKNFLPLNSQPGDAALWQRYRTEPDLFPYFEARLVARAVQRVTGRSDAIETAELISQPFEVDDRARFDLRISHRASRAGEPIVEARQQLGQDFSKRGPEAGRLDRQRPALSFRPEHVVDIADKTWIDFEVECGPVEVPADHDHKLHLQRRDPNSCADAEDVADRSDPWSELHQRRAPLQRHAWGVILYEKFELESSPLRRLVLVIDEHLPAVLFGYTGKEIKIACAVLSPDRNLRAVRRRYISSDRHQVRKRGSYGVQLRNQQIRSAYHRGDGRIGHRDVSNRRNADSKSSVLGPVSQPL